MNEDGEAGFTLLELLVAMTLLGLLMVLVFGGLRFGARVWERSEVHGTGVDEVRLVQSLIRRSIEAAYPYYDTTDMTRPHVAFSGTSGELNILSPAPFAQTNAARANVKFAEVSEGDARKLVMTVKPELGSGAQSGEQEVLLEGLKSVKFSYFGSEVANDTPRWQDDWKGLTRPPLLVRLAIEFQKSGERVWPEMIIAPRISVDVSCRYDLLTKYCQGR